MTAQEIVAVAVSVGGGGSALMLALRGLVAAAEKALPSVVAAFKARSDAKARALKLAAETAAKAQDHEDLVYADFRRDLEELKARLNASDKAGAECEKKYAEVMSMADAAMRMSKRQQREIDALRREMAKRGWTPPEMLAVRPLVDEDDG